MGYSQNRSEVEKKIDCFRVPLGHLGLIVLPLSLQCHF